MEEMITKLTRLKEIDARLLAMKDARRTLKADEDKDRAERRGIVAELRTMGITLAKPRKAKTEKKGKKEKKEPAATA